MFLQDKGISLRQGEEGHFTYNGKTYSFTNPYSDNRPLVVDQFGRVRDNSGGFVQTKVVNSGQSTGQTAGQTQSSRNQIHHYNPNAFHGKDSAVVLNPGVKANNVTIAGHKAVFHGYDKGRQVWKVPGRPGLAGNVVVNGKPGGTSSGTSRGSSSGTSRGSSGSPSIASVVSSRPRNKLDYGSWLRSKGLDPANPNTFNNWKQGYQNYLKS